MVRTRVKEGRKEGRGGYRQEDANNAGAGKEKKGRPKKIWLKYNMTEEMADNRSV